MSGDVVLRPVTDEDAFRLYRWRRDPETVRWSGGRPHDIVWQEHADWLAVRIALPHLYIAEHADQPVGTLRLDRRDAGRWAFIETAAYEVSLVVDPSERGHGYATAILRAAPRLPEPLVGIVHQLNLPSRRAFERAGYVAVAEQDMFSWVAYQRNAE